VKTIADNCTVSSNKFSLPKTLWASTRGISHQRLYMSLETKNALAGAVDIAIHHADFLMTLNL
jgi:hypothetical protein